MILTGKSIVKNVTSGKIRITPFIKNQITTNSYDLRLGTRLIRYTSNILDPKCNNTFEEIIIPKQGILFNPGDFYLGETKEKIGSNYYVPIIHAKSGTARLGLFVHITADLIDIGSYGRITLQLLPTLPVILYPNMLIAQVSFWKPKGKIILYNGKYQGSEGPCQSLSYKDFEKNENFNGN